MLDRDGLIRLHRVASIAHGGSIFWLDMRNTAVIERKTTGVAYAVDPWLLDAGKPPPVFPLSIWLAGWPPHIPPDMEVHLSSRVTGSSVINRERSRLQASAAE